MSDSGDARESTTGISGARASALARGLGDFGFRLLRELEADGNLVFSPLSLWLTLLALIPGARGRTREELTRNLLAEGRTTPEEIAGEAGALARSLARRTGTSWEEDPRTGEWREAPTELFVLEIATALWAAEGYPFHEAYIRTLLADLSAQVESMDFTDSAAAAERMNTWTAERTHGRIPTLVSPSAIHPLTRMALANATYFKAAWACPFREGHTRPAPFRAPQGEVRVDMMVRTCDSGHVRLADPPMHAVEVSYEGMGGLLLVPDPGAIPAVEEALGWELVERAAGGLREKEVTLHLPRFDFGVGLSLEGTLPRLGIREAVGDNADFSGITPHPEGLALSTVLHRARIKVDEDGTEAAAATLAMMAALAEPGEEPEPVTLVVDRPFFFMVRDPESGTVLFLARVMDPSA